jgi:hypothetical protein
MPDQTTAETLTLAMLEQQIASMDPRADDRGEGHCFFCGAEYRFNNDGRLVCREHKPTCLWQQCRYAKYREAIRDTPNWRSYAPKDHESRVRGMWWCKPADWKLAEKGKGRAEVWLNGTWWTWDKNGIGGENAREDSVEAAKAAAEDAIVRQGWGKLEPVKVGEEGDPRDGS